MTDDSGGPQNPFGGDMSIDKMMESYLGVVRGVLDKIPSASGTDQGGPDQGSADMDAGEREILAHLARAQMLWLNRGMGLWRQIGETMVAHGTEATNAMPKDMSDPNAREHRRMIALDKARACLHDIGEMTRISAEEFQQELLDVEVALRESQAPDPYETPKRRARAKR